MYGADPEGLSSLPKARTAFAQMRTELRLVRSRLPEHEIQQRVAVSLLACPDRLVWRAPGEKSIASFLGEALIDFTEEGYFVALLMKRHSGDCGAPYHSRVQNG